MNRKLAFLLTSILLLTLSCSSGGGGSSSGGNTSSSSSGTPSISDLSISPKSVAYNSGGGAATLTLTFNFIDNGGDVTAATVFYYDANGNTISNPVSISGISGKTVGSVSIYMTVLTTARGATTGGVYLTDSGGRESNRLTGSFSII